MPKTQLKTIGALLALLGLAAFFGVLIERYPDIRHSGLTTWNPNEEVRMMIDEGDGNINVYQETANKDESLFGFMQRLRQNKGDPDFSYKEFAGLGVLIEEINGKKNGEQGKNWQYWVNNEYAKVGADSYLLQGGEVIEWKYTTKQPSL